jgi:hypothetical protein
VTTTWRPGSAQWFIGPALRAVTAAGLLVDAVLHLQLAANYQLAAPGGIGQGNLFRIEAVSAALAACVVLALGNRSAYLAGLVVAAGGLGAVLLYRYYQVPAIGPIPAMYEPVWFFKKTLSAVAEGIAMFTAVAGFLSIIQSASSTAANH